MKTAFAEPVSSSESHGCPRSNSLLPKSTDPEIEEGELRLTIDPTRVGMLSVCAVAMEAAKAMTAVVVKCILEILLVIIAVVDKICIVELKESM